MPPVAPDFTSEMDEQSEWSARAACNGEDPTLWDADETKNGLTVITDEVKEAVRICNGCPAKTDCLLHAVVYKIPAGIWGGLTPGQRQAWARRSRLVA